MGSSSEIEKQTEEDLDKIIVENDDFSFIYTAIQLLYHLDKFKNKFKAEESQEKILSYYINKILEKSETSIELTKYSKIIYKIITENYKLEIGKSPGEILIQILQILNLEENGLKPNDDWEKKVLQNNNLLQRTFIINYSFQDFIQDFNNNNKGIISELFTGFLLTKRKMSNNMPYEMFFFSNFLVFEINISRISNSLQKKGNEQLSLFECIYEMGKAKIDFSHQGLLVEHHMYTLPEYLIFFIKREENINYFGDLSLIEEYDFSPVLYPKINQSNNNETQKNKNFYELTGFIKQKRYMAKKGPKSSNQGWFSGNDDNEGNNKYSFIYQIPNKGYFRYNDGNYKEKYKMKSDDNESYYNVLLLTKKN